MPLVLEPGGESGILTPMDLTFYLSGPSTTAFQLLQYFLGKLWSNFAGQLQKLQNRAARVLTHFNYDADVNNLFQLLGWKTVVSQWQIVRATMVFKFLLGLPPEYSCSKLGHRVSGYCLKDSVNKINAPQPRTNYYKSSFSYSGAVLWKTLPLEQRKPESLSQFKRKIKEVTWAIILNTAFMGSSFYFMILSKIVNVVYIVLSVLGFKYLIVYMVFTLLMNCTVVK